MGLTCEQESQHADSVCRLSDRVQITFAIVRLRDLAQEMIRTLEKANRETPDRVPEAYTAFYRTALVRLDELELEKASALESVQDIATELKGVHEAILALYFDAERTTGPGGKTAPMALN